MKKSNKVIITVMLILTAFLSSCRETGIESDTEETGSGDCTNNVGEYGDTENQEDSIMPATREYFENVDKNYRDDDIIAEIGGPSHIKGSGIIYLVWDLTDGTEAYVCFSPDEKIERISIITPGESNELLYKRQYNN